MRGKEAHFNIANIGRDGAKTTVLRKRKPPPSGQKLSNRFQTNRLERLQDEIDTEQPVALELTLFLLTTFFALFNLT